MNGSVTFLHMEWLGLAALIAVICHVALPARRWRLPVSFFCGVLVATVCAAVGWVQWKGELHFAAYGFFMLAGFVAAYVAMIGRSRVIGIPERRVLDMFLIAIIAGMVGCRARYVWERPQEFTHDPVTHAPLSMADSIALAVDFDRGGMVWYGGAVLAAILIILYAWWHRVRILSLADIVLPSLLLGLGIGRIGCFFNGCCYGHPTHVIWGVTCSHYPGEMVHPTQLYETIACTILFVGLWFFWKRRSSDGQVAFWGGIGYGVWRFINEALRGDDKIPSNFLGFPSAHGAIDTSQATSIHIIAVTLIVALCVHLYRRRHPHARNIATLVPGSRYAHPGVDPSVIPEPLSQG